MLTRLSIDIDIIIEMICKMTLKAALMGRPELTREDCFTLIIHEVAIELSVTISSYSIV